HGFPRVGAEMLLRRGITADSDLQQFFEPRLKSLHDPFRLPDMPAAAERAWAAINRKESILIHGDYDVDGMVGTAFLIRMMGAMGARTSYFLPDRVRDGYGLGPAGLEAAAERGATLIVCVDCGVTAVEAATAAAARGIDLIILDHHQPPPALPSALAVVDALRTDADYPFMGLCGVGVAAKFIQAMAMSRPGRLEPAVYVDALQLVALGTIADVVPLLDENRTFVMHGLKALARTEYPGLAALKRLARLTGGPITAEQVAYQVAPRLNAAGRMGVPSLGVELLLAGTIERGEFLARELDNLNLHRRESDQAVSAAARAMAGGYGELPPFIVLWSDDWSAGVIGIAAARVAEEFRRPALLIGMNGDVGRGSARSYAGLDVGGAFARVADLLVAHGGHRQAAGLSVRRENLEALRERLVALAAEEPGDGAPEPLNLEGELRPESVDAGLVAFLDRLAPFGAGSPEPLFLLRGLSLAAPPRIVGTDHLKLTLSMNGRSMGAIGFGLGRHAGRLRESRESIALAATPSPDDWRGAGAIQLKFKDAGVMP
ncbi:MAG TPA: single-stranded-DNA-specific exonuclease RecJ, partial [Candidatus Eisenbacteria bacterium]